MRGLEGLLACNGKFKHHGRISAAGYPLSVSETFQQRNLGKSIDDSWTELEAITAKAHDHKIDLIVYLSMAFGNPYMDDWSINHVVQAAQRLQAFGITTVSLADTIGSAEPTLVDELFHACMEACPDLTFTAHLHSTPDTFEPKIHAALERGCRLLDSAIGGIGGCPFAKDDLTGNIDTIRLLRFLKENGYSCDIDHDALGGLAGEAGRIAQTFSRQD